MNEEVGVLLMMGAMMIIYLIFIASVVLVVGYVILFLLKIFGVI